MNFFHWILSDFLFAPLVNVRAIFLDIFTSILIEIIGPFFDDYNIVKFHRFENPFFCLNMFRENGLLIPEAIIKVRLHEKKIFDFVKFYGLILKFSSQGFQKKIY
jgi:hypothetical protein